MLRDIAVLAVLLVLVVPVVMPVVRLITTTAWLLVNVGLKAIAVTVMTLLEPVLVLLPIGIRVEEVPKEPGTPSWLPLCVDYALPVAALWLLILRVLTLYRPWPAGVLLLIPVAHAVWLVAGYSRAPLAWTSSHYFAERSVMPVWNHVIRGWFHSSSALRAYEQKRLIHSSLYHRRRFVIALAAHATMAAAAFAVVRLNVAAPLAEVWTTFATSFGSAFEVVASYTTTVTANAERVFAQSAMVSASLLAMAGVRLALFVGWRLCTWPRRHERAAMWGYIVPSTACWLYLLSPWSYVPGAAEGMLTDRLLEAAGPTSWAPILFMATWLHLVMTTKMVRWSRVQWQITATMLFLFAIFPLAVFANEGRRGGAAVLDMSCVLMFVLVAVLDARSHGAYDRTPIARAVALSGIIAIAATWSGGVSVVEEVLFGSGGATS